MVKQAILEELFSVVRSVDQDQILEFTSALRTAGRVFVQGKGRMGQVLRVFAAELFDLGFDTYWIGEMSVPPIGAGDLLIVTPTGGDPKSSTRFLEVARQAGARVAAVTARRDGPIGRLADLFVEAGARTMNPEGVGVPSLQPMSTTLEQAGLVLFSFVIRLLGCAEGQDYAASLGALLNEIREAVLALDEKQALRLIQLLGNSGGRLFFAAYRQDLFVLSCFAMRLHHMGREVFVLNELRWPPVRPGDVVIVLRGPFVGRGTATIMREMRGAGASVVMLRPGSAPPAPWEAGCNIVLLPDARRSPSDRSAASGAYLPAMLVILDYLVIRMMEINGLTERGLEARHTNLE
jgi:6-phospho-3-hexuloisomerase